LSNFKRFKNVLHGARILNRFSALNAIGLAVLENKVAGKKKMTAMVPTISCHQGGRPAGGGTSGGRRCYLAADPI
jgi:hypothetical protein